MKTDNFRKPKALFEFEKKVHNTIESNGLATSCDRILVALSGGADSVCLLRVLFALSEKCGFKICACHLNHGIRELAADSDEAFSKKLCDHLGIQFISERINIPEIKESCGGSIETVAREQRYKFFERAAKKLGCNKIATAHTMSDNAETVLFNISRGTSSDGVSGIPVKRGIFIRPLLNCARSEIESYLSGLSQNYVTDATNSDQNYTRNFIRHTIVPNLKTINPLFEEAVLRLSQSANIDKDYFEFEVKKLIDMSPSLDAICEMHPALALRYIKHLCEISGTYADTNRINAIYCATKETSENGGKKEISLPENYVAYISADGISIEKKSQSIAESFNIPLTYGNNTINENFCIYIGQSNEFLPEILKNENFVYKLYKNIKCRSDIIENGIFAKSRENGDRVVISGMTRKLKKVFSETKLCNKQRESIPLVCDLSGNIIALPLFSVPSDSARPVSEKNYTQIAFYTSENINI